MTVYFVMNILNILFLQFYFKSLMKTNALNQRKAP